MMTTRNQGLEEIKERYGNDAGAGNIRLEWTKLDSVLVANGYVSIILASFAFNFSVF